MLALEPHDIIDAVGAQFLRVHGGPLELSVEWVSANIGDPRNKCVFERIEVVSHGPFGLIKRRDSVVKMFVAVPCHNAACPDHVHLSVGTIPTDALRAVLGDLLAEDMGEDALDKVALALYWLPPQVVVSFPVGAG